MNDKFEQEERKFQFHIVDHLAHEYGWTVEYVSSLTMPEVAGLLNQIKERQNTEDLRMQMNVAKAFAGKISSNFEKVENSSKPDVEAEIKGLKNLSKVLNIPLKKVKKE